METKLQSRVAIKIKCRNDEMMENVEYDTDYYWLLLGNHVINDVCYVLL